MTKGFLISAGGLLCYYSRWDCGPENMAAFDTGYIPRGAYCFKYAGFAHVTWDMIWVALMHFHSHFEFLGFELIACNF